MNYFLQLLILGITEGSIYILIALGIIITYKATNVVNLAQGEYVVLGGFILATLRDQGISLVISLLLSIATVGFVVGGLVGILVFRPFLGKNISPGIILTATIGLDMFLKMITMLIWGKLPISVPYFTGDTPVVFGQLRIDPQSLWVVGTTVVAFVLVILLLERSVVGKAFRACAENRFYARLVGINDKSMVLLALIVSATLGALAGAVVSPISYAKFDLGIIYAFNGFIAAVIGGLEKPMGALFGGMVIGILSSVSAGYLGAGVREILVVLALLVILTVKPTGLYAGHGGGD